MYTRSYSNYQLYIILDVTFINSTCGFQQWSPFKSDEKKKNNKSSNVHVGNCKI